MLKSVLFVSRQAAGLDEFALELYRIEQASRRRNAELGITGALLSTKAHFAAVLEGEAEPLARLMACIARDPRHEQVTIVEERTIRERRFTGWSLCYSGPSIFADRLVTPLMTAADGAPRLRHFMQELATAA